MNTKKISHDCSVDCSVVSGKLSTHYSCPKNSNIICLNKKVVSTGRIVLSFFMILSILASGVATEFYIELQAAKQIIKDKTFVYTTYKEDPEVIKIMESYTDEILSKEIKKLKNKE